MVFTQSTHPLEMTVASDVNFANIIVNDTVNAIVNKNLDINCISEIVTLYIKVENEEHDSTNLTINDPEFELCGMDLVDPSLSEVSSSNDSKVWKYVFKIKRTSTRVTTQLMIKVTEGNEGPDVTTTPFSVTRLINLEVVPASITYVGTEQAPSTQVFEFQITNPSDIYLGVREEITSAIETSIEDVVGDIASLNCDPLNAEVQIKVDREIYPYFFDKDCTKFLFNYKRVDDMSWCPLNSFDENNITSDIGVNTLTYRVINRKSGAIIKNAAGTELYISKVILFNPVIHIQESRVTIPEGGNKYDSSSNLVPHKGDLFEIIYPDGGVVSTIKQSYAYNFKVSVIVWQQGAKPGDSTPDYILSMDPKTTLQYFVENQLIDINVTSYDLVFNNTTCCYDLSQCGNTITMNYQEFKQQDFNTFDLAKLPGCIESPVYKVTLSFHGEVCCTHIWDETLCEYVKNEQGIQGTELNDKWNEKEEKHEELVTACRRVDDQLRDLSNAIVQNNKYQVSEVAANDLDASYNCLMDKYDSYKITFSKVETFDALTASYEAIKNSDNADLLTASGELLTAKTDYDASFAQVETDLDDIQAWIAGDLANKIADLQNSDLSGQTLDELTVHARQVENVFAHDLSFNRKTVELVVQLGDLVNKLSAMQALLLDLSGSNVAVEHVNDGDYNDLLSQVNAAHALVTSKYNAVITTAMTYTDLSLNASGATLSGNYDLSGSISVDQLTSDLFVTVTPSWEIFVSEVRMDVSYVDTLSYEVLSYATNLSTSSAHALIDLDVSYSLSEIQAKITAANIIESITSDFSGTLGATGNMIVDISLDETTISYYDASTAHVEQINFLNGSHFQNQVIGGENVLVLVDPSGDFADIIDLSSARESQDVVTGLIGSGLSWNNAEALFEGAAELDIIFSDISGDVSLNDISSNLTVSLINKTYTAFIETATLNKVQTVIPSITYVAQVTDLTKDDIDISSTITTDVSYGLTEFMGLLDSSGTVSLTNMLVNLTGATGALNATFNNANDGFNNYISELVTALQAHSGLVSLQEDLSGSLAVQAAYNSYVADISSAAASAQTSIDSFKNKLEAITNDMSGALSTLIHLAIGTSTQDSMDAFNSAKDAFLTSTSTYYSKTDTYYTDLVEFFVSSKNYFEAEAKYEAERAKAELANDLYNLYKRLTDQYNAEKDNCVTDIAGMIANLDSLHVDFKATLLEADSEYEPNPNSLFTSANFLPLDNTSMELFADLKGVMDNVEATKDWLQQIATKLSMLDNEQKLHALLVIEKNAAQAAYDAALAAWQAVFDALKAAGEFSVDDSLFERISFNLSERYIYFREDHSQRDLHIKYGGTADTNNSLLIDDLVNNASKTISVHYGADDAVIKNFEVKQSLTKYPEGSNLRPSTVITQMGTTNNLGIFETKPHEFIVKITTPEMTSIVCELSGCLTTKGTIYGPKTITEMFNIELAYQEANSNARIFMPRNEFIRKVEIVSGPSGNAIDENIIYTLFEQKDVGLPNNVRGLTYQDNVVGTYLFDDDYIQHSVYVDRVSLIHGTPTSNGKTDIETNLGLTALLKDYKLTNAKLAAAGLTDGCLPNDLLGFEVVLRYNTLAADDHNDSDSRTETFTFYHVNGAFTLDVANAWSTDSNKQAICIEFVVDDFQFKSYQTELLDGCLRHNPNYRNTNVGTGTPDPDLINTQGTEEYTQYDTLYVTPRLAESNGAFNTAWIDTTVQHDNRQGKAAYRNDLGLCFTTNYGNNFNMFAVDMSNPATNVTQDVNHSYSFDNASCLQLTNNAIPQTDNLNVRVERSTQDPLFRREIGDIADATKFTAERNAALDMEYKLSYTDFQGFYREVTKEFVWDIKLCPILEPTLHMDDIEFTLMDNSGATMCRPFWMRVTEFGEWIKHAYERKLLQDITTQELEPTHAALDETNGLDDPNVPRSHMYIDNKGEFHTQYGERVWLDSVVSTYKIADQPGYNITLNGKGHNVVGMEATSSVSTFVPTVCEQNDPVFLNALENCVSTTNGDDLIDAILGGNGNAKMRDLFDLEVKYWNAQAYWASHAYTENEYHDPNKVEVDGDNNHEAIDFEKLTELSPEDVYTTDKSYEIDTTRQINIVYKETPESISYSTGTLASFIANGGNKSQISVMEIPLIKKDEPEIGHPQREETTTMKVNIQDNTDPVVTLVNPEEVADLINGADNWLSQKIKVSHSRYVFEFAHFVNEGYLWDALNVNNGKHCINMRELLAPTPLAYESTTAQLNNSTMIRDTNNNSLQFDSEITGVVSNCCGPIYNDTYVTRINYTSARSINNPDMEFNGDSFVGDAGVYSFNSTELNVPIASQNGTYVATLTDESHILGACTDINGTGANDELNGELVFVEQGYSLWNRMGLAVDQTFIGIASHNKQDDHRFTSLRVLARDVNMKYPTCGIVRVATRAVMPTQMTETCHVNTTTCSDHTFKSTLNDELLGGFCGLVQDDIFIDDKMVNDEQIKEIAEGCKLPALDASGNLSPVVFANLTGMLACPGQISFTVDASMCKQSRYTEFDVNSQTREVCEDDALPLSIVEEVGPSGEAMFVIYSSGQRYVLENKIINMTMVSKLVDYELFCRSFCSDVFTGSYDLSYVKLMGSGDVNDAVCDANDSLTRSIKIETCVVPQLEVVGRPHNSVSVSVTQDVNNNNTHFTDSDWANYLNVTWNVSDQMKIDADGNSNIRVLIREIRVEGASHYQGDINNLHLVYDQKQQISTVINSSHKVDTDDDITRLFNNELEAGNASSLRIDANPGEEINVSYMAVAFIGDYVAVSDIMTVNYNITLTI